MTKLLTPFQAFCVMQIFLEEYFNVTSSDSIGALLGCMHFLDDGETADPALWEDWCKITDHHTITTMQAFRAMDIFLRMYFQQTSSINVKNMLNDISLVVDDKVGKEGIWQKWMACVDQVVE